MVYTITAHFIVSFIYVINIIKTLCNKIDNSMHAYGFGTNNMNLEIEVSVENVVVKKQRKPRTKKTKILPTIIEADTESEVTLVEPINASNELVAKPTMPIIVTAHDINGILYFICNNNIVYDPDDIMFNTINPRVIGIYDKQNSCIHFQTMS